MSQSVNMHSIACWKPKPHPQCSMSAVGTERQPGIQCQSGHSLIFAIQAQKMASMKPRFAEIPLPQHAS